VNLINAMARPSTDCGGNMGAVSMDFDYFANLVYNHTTAMPQHRALLGQNATNLDMGNYSRAPDCRDIAIDLFQGAMRSACAYHWRALSARASPAPSGATDTLTVANNGLQGKGAIAERLTVNLNIPADTTVVAATGTGYQGVHTDDKANAGVAVWQLPRSAPKDQERITVTLSKAATSAANLRGQIPWAKPAPKTGPSQDVVNIAPAPL
jgi:hypothetical protein